MYLHFSQNFKNVKIYAFFRENFCGKNPDIRRLQSFCNIWSSPIDCRPFPSQLHQQAKDTHSVVASVEQIKFHNSVQLTLFHDWRQNSSLFGYGDFVKPWKEKRVTLIQGSKILRECSPPGRGSGGASQWRVCYQRRLPRLV